MTLNNLTAREWLPLTRSAFIDGVAEPSADLTWENALQFADAEDHDAFDGAGSTAVLSRPQPRSAAKRLHPATFPESDAGRLIRFFTKYRETVLDPFIGSGSTAVAANREGRNCLGFELYDHWADIARQRVDLAWSPGVDAEIRTVEALAGLSELPDRSIDFILTSPPYWQILRKKDKKARRERVAPGLPTEYGSDSRDLGNVRSYDEFLQTLQRHFAEWRRVLRPRGYSAVIVSDFRHGKRYHPFHADIGRHLEQAGFTLQGIVVIVQDNKRLYPYGFPTTYVPNICNQFVVIGRAI